MLFRGSVLWLMTATGRYSLFMEGRMQAHTIQQCKADFVCYFHLHKEKTYQKVSTHVPWATARA
jgi:hypothetical protein